MITDEQAQKAWKKAPRLRSEQMCLHEDIYESFMEKFMKKVEALKIGNPLDEAVELGEKMESMVLNSTWIRKHFM